VTPTQRAAARASFYGSWERGQYVRMDRKIHLVSDGEHLLCNLATSDAAASEDDPSLTWHKTTSTTVTCTACITTIELVRAHLEKTR